MPNSVDTTFLVENNESAEPLGKVENEIAELMRSLNEAGFLLDQSKAELNRLVQRNAGVTNQIQKMQANIESISKADLHQIHCKALESQQRLLVMRSQVERLQSEINLHSRSVQFLESIKDLLSTFGSKTGFTSKASSTVLEMVINAQESERQKLSRQMHDGPAQALSNLIVQAEITEKYFDFDPAKAKEELSTLKESAAATFQTIRNFIFELRPMMLDDLGLFPTVRRYIEAFKQQTKTQVNFVIYGQERRMEPYLEAMLFRAIQELLRNAYQHNKDNSNQFRIDVQFSIDEKNIRLSVNDTGKGFDPKLVHENTGLGLKLIRERLEMLGGTLEIDTSVNQGCNVIVQAPYLDVGVRT